MRLTFVCDMDYAGVGYNLTEAIRRHTKIETHLVSLRPHQFKYKNDIIYNHDKRRASKLIVESDIIMFLNKYKPIRTVYPTFKRAMGGIIHGGSEYRLNYLYYKNQVHPLCKYVFAHRDLLTLDGRAKLLNVPFDTDKHTPISLTTDKIYISHSPSSEDIKGTKYFIDAITILKNKFDNIEGVLIKDADNQKSIEIKKSTHIFFDQIGSYKIPPNATKGYGMSLIEAASVGNVCLNWSEYVDTPIITVNSTDDIVRECTKLIENPRLLTEKSIETRAWVERVHGYKNVAENFIKDLGLSL